MVDKTT